MAIYHLSIKIISRSQGRSAVASAAYRSGERLYSEETETVFDYSFKGGVEHSEIALPDNAPEQFLDRQTLWNSVQTIENKSDSQLAREFEVALPLECNKEEWIEIGREFAAYMTAQGMIADWAIHNPVDKETGLQDNPHIHMMCTTRPLTKDGEWASKMKKVYKLDANGERIPVIDPKTGKQKIGARNRKMWQRETVERNEWDDRSKAKEWRAKWSEVVNKHLAPENHIDHRSYKDQGLDLIPTVHEGYKARKLDKELMQEKGIHAEKIQKNIEIKKQNELIKALHELIRNLKEKAGEIYDRYKEQIRELGKSGSIFDRIRNAFTNTEYGKSGVASREPAFEHRKRDLNGITKDIEQRERAALERERKVSKAAADRDQEALGREPAISGAIKEANRIESKHQELKTQAQNISVSWDISCSEGRYKDLTKAIGNRLIRENELHVMNKYKEQGFNREGYDYRYNAHVYIVKPSQQRKVEKVLQGQSFVTMPIVYSGKGMLAVISNVNEYYFKDHIKSVEADFWIYANHKKLEKKPELKPGIKEVIDGFAKEGRERQRTLDRQPEIKGGHGTADYGSLLEGLGKEANAPEKPSIREKLEDAKEQVKAREAERQPQKHKEIDEPEGPSMGLW